ncbi:1336_t:CDS:2, partial [Entrophospora sp. SA101]
DSSSSSNNKILDSSLVDEDYDMPEIKFQETTLTRANSALIQSDDSDYLQNQLINH